jgi:hypothetical protein
MERWSPEGRRGPTLAGILDLGAGVENERMKRTSKQFKGSKLFTTTLGEATPLNKHVDVPSQKFVPSHSSLIRIMLD